MLSSSRIIRFLGHTGLLDHHCLFALEASAGSNGKRGPCSWHSCLLSLDITCLSYIPFESQRIFSTVRILFSWNITDTTHEQDGEKEQTSYRCLYHLCSRSWAIVPWTLLSQYSSKNFKKWQQNIKPSMRALWTQSPVWQHSHMPWPTYVYRP